MSELTSSLQPDTERRASFLGDAWRQLRRNPIFWLAGVVVAVMVLMAVVPGLFAGWFGHGDPRVCDLGSSGAAPVEGHPFGFDKQGCDVYANVVYGARASISVGVLVTLGSLVLAIVLGSLAGFYGRMVDVVVSRLTDVFFGFPFILGALVVLTSFDNRNVWTVSLVLAMFGWPTLTRLMRSTVLATRDLEYVTAARALGASDVRVLLRHILPNAIAPVIVIGTLSVGGVIVAEAALTFLGIGLQSPAISWGLQLSTAQNDFQAYPHLLVFPSLFLSVTVLAFILLGDVLRDALDPRLHR
ncbi:ABC transporter permease [Tenggerimyces flavus]|uniref:ABC transporter permease n=1 Tax=Tenggerimyces flavus TaxID=1708749 RepID=A0ABV7YQZ5_9ACTN|nr:ABC transporter permease [Tenggerimyces flavus]MBM7786177.1 oligopeptide transport system permease protein [Tenggerimyces flavus]